MLRPLWQSLNFIFILYLKDIQGPCFTVFRLSVYLLQLYANYTRRFLLFSNYLNVFHTITLCFCIRTKHFPEKFSIDYQKTILWLKNIPSLETVIKSYTHWDFKIDRNIFTVRKRANFDRRFFGVDKISSENDIENFDTQARQS